MFTLTKQEIFKLVHKKSTWLCSLVLLIGQLTFALLEKGNYYMTYFDYGYMGLSLITLFLIAGSATIITSEFEWGTIKELLYRKYSRVQVLVSKWITILLYSIYWFVLEVIFTLVLKAIIFPKVNLGASVGDYTHLSFFSAYQGADLLTTWLLITLVFLLANVFNNSAVAVSVGIVASFIINLAGTFLYGLIGKWEWTKWNPITMLVYPNQLVDPHLAQMTKLSFNQLATGNIIYIVIFLAIGYLVFKKRNV